MWFWIREGRESRQGDINPGNKGELCRYEMEKVTEKEGKYTTQSNFGADPIDRGHSSPIDHEQESFTP